MSQKEKKKKRGKSDDLESLTLLSVIKKWMIKRFCFCKILFLIMVAIMVEFLKGT